MHLPISEDSQTQFKVDLTSPKALASEITAMTNSIGGRIFVGVDDDGQAVGLSRDQLQTINQMIANVCDQQVKPAISVITKVVEIQGKPIIVIDVPEGIDKPYCDSNGFYWVKVGSDKHKAVREEIQRMFQNTGKLFADETVTRVSLDKLDTVSFSQFYKAKYGFDWEQAGQHRQQILANLHLAEGDFLTLAGALLFGNFAFDFDFIGPQYELKAVNFVGTEMTGTQFRDSDTFRGPLKTLYKDGLAFLNRNLRKYQTSDSFNAPGRMEISPIALQELLINALLHRDYLMMSAVKIFMFDDRVEIKSPGTLPNSLTVDSVKSGVSIHRNPILNSFAIDVLPYKGIGSGIVRAISEQPDIDFINDRDRLEFRVVIPRKSG